MQDLRRSARRRRLVTVAVAFALLAMTASAAIATGWLSDKTPATRAVGDGGTAIGQTQVLMSGLGAERRTLSAEHTQSGSVCLALTGFAVQCVPSLLARQQLAWFVWWAQTGPAIVWGIVRDGVTGVDAVARDGTVTSARVANEAFYLELDGGPPRSLVAHLEDGKSVTHPLSACPPTTPNCAP
jgi:hypothetical protein